MLELLFQHVFTPLTPQMLSSPLFFASVSLPQTFFAPAAALPELFPLPSDSFSAVVRLSPLPCSFLLRIPHSLSLWLVRTLPLLLPHSLSGLP